MKQARHAARRTGLARGLVYGGFIASIVILIAVLAGWRLDWRGQAALAAVLGLQFSSIARLFRHPRMLVFCPDHQDHEHR